MEESPEQVDANNDSDVEDGANEDNLSPPPLKIRN